MNQRKCLKCGHETAFEGMPPASCEKCGAIYSKVERSMSGSHDSRPARTAPTQRQPRARPIEDFAEVMRSESLYPTWREIVKFITLLGYLMSIGVLLGAIFAFTQGGVGAGIGMVFGAIVVAILARAWKELSLMVADLADASVRHAAHRENTK